MRRADTLNLVESRCQALCGEFAHYVALYDRAAPFRKAGQLPHHIETIRLRKAAGGVRPAVENPRFIESLHRTLQAWGMDTRAATLVSAERLGEQLRWVLPLMERLQPLRIDHEGLDADRIATAIWEIIGELDITESKNRIVSGTKTLHHCLPGLIPPMDRQYTRMFFQWYQPQFQREPERVFRDMFTRFVQISRDVSPLQYVGDGWRTSRTKILDNALVAYCIHHNIQVS